MTYFQRKNNNKFITKCHSAFNKHFCHQKRHFGYGNLKSYFLTVPRSAISQSHFWVSIQREREQTRTSAAQIQLQLQSTSIFFKGPTLQLRTRTSAAHRASQTNAALERERERGERTQLRTSAAHRFIFRERERPAHTGYNIVPNDFYVPSSSTSSLLTIFTFPSSERESEEDVGGATSSARDSPKTSIAI